jgi:hypothetical protein
VQRLALLSTMHSTSHRWVDKTNVAEQITPALFEFRVRNHHPLLTAHPL